MFASEPASKKGVSDFAYIVLMRGVWRYVREYRFQYIIALVLMFLSAMIWLLPPYLIGRLFNTIQDGLDSRSNVEKALLILFLYFLANPVSWALHGPGRVMENRIGFWARKNFVHDMYAKLQIIPFAWHQNFHSGQLFDRIRKAEDAIERFASNQFRYIYAAVNFIGPLVALTFFFPVFGAVMVAFSIVAIYMIYKYDQVLIPIYRNVNKLKHEYAGIFSDYISNIRTLITLRLGEPTKTELLHRYEAQRPLKWREYTVNEWKWASIEILTDFIKMALIAAAIIAVYKGADFKIGSLVMLIQYLERYSGVFFNLGTLYQDVVKGAADYKSIHVIDDAYDEYVRDHNDDKPVAQEWERLDIRDFSFSYKDASDRPHAIQGVSFSVFAGQKIALVGSSGSGKSTLMTLLRGLYQPESGTVVIDGNVHTPEKLKALTALIPQEPEIFENTIAYNITFGVEHSDEEIARSCEIAAFDSVVLQLPMGLHSDIREKGVNLSGGQKQRLALARGVFAIRESSLILLDEPTSSVDTMTELKIFDRLFDEFKDKAMIASVHRLHLLPRFDYVLVMDKGRLVEHGRFADLVVSNGLLASLWRHYNAAKSAVAMMPDVEK